MSLDTKRYESNSKYFDSKNIDELKFIYNSWDLLGKPIHDDLCIYLPNRLFKELEKHGIKD